MSVHRMLASCLRGQSGGIESPGTGGTKMLATICRMGIKSGSMGRITSALKQEDLSL